MYQDLSTRLDSPVKKDIVDLPINMKGNPKRTSANSLSRLIPRTRLISAVLRRGYYKPRINTSATQARSDSASSNC